MSRYAIGVALGCALLMVRAYALSHDVILRLHAAAHAQYADSGGVMDRYNVMIFRGKAYATTRGTVNAVATVAVWEYVPPEWHRVFDYPLTEANSAEVTQHYRSYGFTSIMQKRLLGAAHPFP
jgi:hypothetical protein